MKKIVLFDMDGTITPPRQSMKYDMASLLANLQHAGYEIGIVTGSDLDYLKQQCNIMFDISPVDYCAIHYLPCNGTKYYRYLPGFSSEKVIYNNDMKKEIGDKNWNELIKTLVNLQAFISNVYSDMPLTGHFVNYRGSTINWCPIGRQASSNE